jgi:hypothetical protein
MAARQTTALLRRTVCSRCGKCVCVCVDVVVHMWTTLSASIAVQSKLAVAHARLIHYNESCSSRHQDKIAGS